MTIKYWPILLCVLMMLASCGAKKEKTFVDTPDIRPQCSDEEKAELIKKATEDYSFVILPKQLAEPQNKWFCYDIRRFIKAVDLLPPKVRGEYERLKREYGLKINIAGFSLDEDGFHGEEYKNVNGVFNNYLRSPSIAITARATKKTLWHEIGHFLDQTMPAFTENVSCISCNTDEFASAYSPILKDLKERNQETYFMKNKREGFAESFSFYVSNQVEDGMVGHSDYKIFQPLFSFFDELFDNPHRLIIANDNRRK